MRTAPSVVSLIQRSRRTARLVTAERRSMEQTLAATIRPVPSFMRRQRRWQRNGGYPLLQFDLDQLNWHGRACHEAERYQAQTMEALPVGLLGRLYYLSKILKLSINRERRTSLIKIIHALLLASPAYCSASPYSQDSSSIELAPAA